LHSNRLYRSSSFFKSIDTGPLLALNFGFTEKFNFSLLILIDGTCSYSMQPNCSPYRRETGESCGLLVFETTDTSFFENGLRESKKKLWFFRPWTLLIILARLQSFVVAIAYL